MPRDMRFQNPVGPSCGSAPTTASTVWAGASATTVYTVVADAPAATVDAVVGALPHDGPTGFWKRMKRGLGRLASWANPFH